MDRRWLVWIGLVVGAAAAGYIATWALYPAQLPSDEVSVPHLRGVTRDDALAQLTALGLRARDGGTLADPLTPRGTVSWHTPPPETAVPQGSVVRLGISTGAPTVEVPDVTEFGLGLATRVLEAAGLRLGEVDSTRADQPVGTILRTTPGARTAIRAGRAVDVTVSRGRMPTPTRRP